MDSAVLIPTQQRKKLSPGFSYTFGAQEVSQFLFGFRHLTHCRLWFSNRAIYRHSQWQQILRAEGELEIFTCEPTFDSETWDVRLYAVPSSKRAAAREAFEVRVSPAFTAWAMKGRIHSFKVFFNLGREEIRVESHP